MVPRVGAELRHLPAGGNGQADPVAGEILLERGRAVGA